MKTKVCTKCKMKKSLNEFRMRYDKRSGNNYPNSTCKLCDKLITKEYREKNKDNLEFKKRKALQDKKYREKNREKIQKFQKEYRENNKEKKKEYDKTYYEKNKGKILKQRKEYNKQNKENILNYQKEYYQKNKEIKKQYQKEYSKNNKEKIVEYHKNYYVERRHVIEEYKEKNREEIRRKAREYSKQDHVKKRKNKLQREREKNDINYKIKRRLRSRLSGIVKNDYKSVSTMELLGCDIQEFKKYLKQYFVEGMTWENYGDWHIDHIVPCSAFDLTKVKEQKICFHFTNLQPLWAKDNLKKSNKII